MTPKGKSGNFNMWKIVAVFLIALLLGNLLGHSLGFGEDSEDNGKKKKETEEEKFQWFGLAKYWREPEKEKQLPSWW